MIKNVQELINEYGKDWSSVENITIDLSTNERKDLRDIILPKNPEFFSLCVDRRVANCLLPEGDYSIYDMTDVQFLNVRFTDNSILGEDFFTLIDGYSGTIVLPSQDYTNFDFNCNITEYLFGKTAKLPKNFFEQLSENAALFDDSVSIVLPIMNTEDLLNVRNFELEGTFIFRPGTVFDKDFFKVKVDENCSATLSIPPYDFSDFNFEEAVLWRVNFHNDCKLPSNSGFFRKLGSLNLLSVKLPELDYSKYEFANIYFCEVAFPRKATVSEKLFAECRYGELIKCILPEMDYSLFDFKGFSFAGCYFPKNSILPMNKQFFTDLITQNSLRGTTLPLIDFNNYETSEVSFNHCRFAEGTVFSKEMFPNGSFKAAKFPSGDYSLFDMTLTDLAGAEFTSDSKVFTSVDSFVRLKGKSLSGVTLPKGDYRLHSFANVDITAAKFTEDSLLPEDRDFFNSLNSKVNLFSVELPNNVIYNIHNYDLSNVKLDLAPYTQLLKPNQLEIISNMYPEKVGRDILLPNKENLPEIITQESNCLSF